LGGAQNLLTVGACTTRLRLEMVDRNKASDADLKALGAMAVVRPGKGGSLQVVVGPLADSIADEIRLAMPALGRALVPAPAVQVEASNAAWVTAPEAQQWLTALGGRENVLQLDCIALTRLRLQLADGKALSEAQLKELGCQGVSSLDGGVWHLLIGEKAASLSGAIEALVNRSETRAKV
jgi:PTS system N-acetylglucosamine-specific IIC component